MKERIFMTQKTYAQNILTTFKIKNCTQATTPIHEKVKLKANMEKEVDPTLCCYIISKCLHMTHTHLDIQQQSDQ